MFKPGEELKVGEKQFVVTECETTTIRCRMCASANRKGIPCIQQGQYCITDWNQQMCKQHIPDNCYLKPKQ